MADRAEARRWKMQEAQKDFEFLGIAAEALVEIRDLGQVVDDQGRAFLQASTVVLLRELSEATRGIYNAGLHVGSAGRQLDTYIGPFMGPSRSIYTYATQLQLVYGDGARTNIAALTLARRRRGLRTRLLDTESVIQGLSRQLDKSEETPSSQRNRLMLELKELSVAVGMAARDKALAGEATLRDANFYGVRNHSIMAIGLDMRSSNFSHADLSYGYFTDALLDDANFEDSILTAAVFARASLRGVRMTRVDLKRAKLESADLSGADLSEAAITFTSLDGALWNDHTSWPSDIAESVRENSEPMGDGTYQITIGRGKSRERVDS